MKYINLVVSITIIFLLVSCKDSGVNNKGNKDQIAFDNIKGEWIHYKSIETQIKMVNDTIRDTTVDTMYFSLDGINSAMSKSMIHFKENSLWDFSSSNPDVPEQYDITSISDSTISLKDEIHRIDYLLKGDTLIINNGALLTSLKKKDRIRDEKVEPIQVITMTQGFFKRYSGTIPPVEWK